MTSRIEFFSRTACFFQSDMRFSLLGRLNDGLTERGRQSGLARIDSAQQIPHHDQRTAEDEEAAQRPDDVEWVHRLDGLHERVFKEAEAGIGAPHEALQDA